MYESFPQKMQQITYSVNGLTFEECKKVTEYIEKLRRRSDQTPKPELESQERKGKKWTVEEEERLLFWVANGKHRKDIALEMGRTSHAIFCRLCYVAGRKRAEGMEGEAIAKMTGLKKGEWKSNTGYWKARNEEPIRK